MRDDDAMSDGSVPVRLLLARFNDTRAVSCDSPAGSEPPMALPLRSRAVSADSAVTDAGSVPLTLLLVNAMLTMWL